MGIRLRGDSTRAGFVERFFTVIIFILFSGAVLPMLRSNGADGVDSSEGDPVAQLLFFGSYAGSLLFLIRCWKRAAWTATREPFVWILAGLAMVSVLWSEVADLTLRRSIALLGTNLVGVYVAARYPWVQQIRLLSWALAFVAVASLFAVLFVPDFGVGSTGWQGAFVTKNTFGRMMALASLIFLLGGVMRVYSRWIALSGFAVATFLVVMSSSKTALVIVLALVIALPVSRVLQWHFSVAVPSLVSVTALGAIVVLFVAINVEPLADALGRDTTLTGRTELWSLARSLAWEERWLGYGYSGFWLGWNGPSDYIWYATGWTPPHAHLGFLDLWLELGLVALVIFIVSFLLSYSRAIMAATRGREQLWPLMYLTFLLLANMTESNILSRNSLYWLLYVTLALSLGEARGRAKEPLERQYIVRRTERIQTYGSA